MSHHGRGKGGKGKQQQQQEPEPQPLRIAKRPAQPQQQQDDEPAFPPLGGAKQQPQQRQQQHQQHQQHQQQHQQPKHQQQHQQQQQQQPPPGFSQRQYENPYQQQQQQPSVGIPQKSSSSAPSWGSSSSSSWGSSNAPSAAELLKQQSPSPSSQQQQPRTTTTTTTSSLSSSSSSQQPRTTTTTTATASSSGSVPTNVPRGRLHPDVKDIDVVGLAPQTGQIGLHKNSKRVNIYTNFFPMIFKNKAIYQYQVDFSPTLETRDQRTNLISQMNFPVYRYDGSAQLYLPIRVEDKGISINDVRVTIKMVKPISSQEKEAVQFFNILTKKFFYLMGYSMIGRNYYTNVNAYHMREYNLQIWKGFTSSVSFIEEGAALLCDMSSKVVRSIDVLQKFSEAGFNRAACENIVQNSIVLTRYNNKTYRISGVAWNVKLTDKIDANLPSFIEYYRNNYPKFPIKDMKQPLLETQIKFQGKPKKAYLVPELCHITGLGEEISSNFHVMAEVAKFSNVDPPIRLKELNEFIGRLPSHEKVAKELNDWNVCYNPSLKVEGVCLPPPQLHVFKNALRDIDWVLLVSKDDFSKCKDVVPQLQKETGLPEPIVVHPLIQKRGRDIDPRGYLDELKYYAEKNVKLFVIIIPQNSKDIYSVIKQKALCEYKIITQCIYLRTFLKGRPVAQKLNQQMVAKMGDAPWVLKSQTHPNIPKKTMVIGIDVGHNSDTNGRSVVGFVASLDDDYCAFYSRAIVQSKSGKEIIDDSLYECTLEALKRYHTKNKCLPELVMVYRDGVGDGMLKLVKDFEVEAMNRAFIETPSIYGMKPKLVYIIVKKNTNVRFFQGDSLQNYNQFRNPEPGTLIENKVTHPGWYDFFLVSQVAFKGSVNPTHYNVIRDDAQIPRDALQQFTFAMCHLYYNFDKSVRVPAPCQYAHRLAFLIGRSVHRNADNELAHKLYFL